jgi:hypothetical protein
LGAKYIASPTTTLALGYGLHSKTVPFGNYFIRVDGQLPNHDLKLMKSHHLILALDQVFARHYRIHLEGYYQYQYNLPVAVSDPARKIFVLNRLWGFDADPLESVGTGTNYGMDFSVEKFFDKGSFFVLSGSVMRAYFTRPDDEKRYDSNYDMRFGANFTGGQIFPLGENTFLETGVRFVYNSGYPITPLLTGQLRNDGYDPPFDWSRPNDNRLPAFFRPDLRVALRNNRPKSAWWLALDIQNFINRKNEFSFYQFDRELDQWQVLQQNTLTPVLSFWLDI